MSDDTNWKRQHAIDSERAAEHPLIEDALTEFARNMGFERKGLPEYGLLKIVATVAIVVRARTLGFDPELLRLTPEEANERLQAKARAMVAAGIPTLRVDRDGTTTRLD